MPEFHLDSYIQQQQLESNEIDLAKDDETYQEFYLLCEDVRKYIKNKFNEESEKMITIQKKAILGHAEQIKFYTETINEYLSLNNRMHVKFPPWYDSLDEGIFHENYGLTGIQKWKKDKTSSSCKVIGNRIYYMINGQQVLQKQKITSNRFEKLKNSLLLGYPEKRKTDPYHEIYMLDGTRIEIYNNTKEPCIVFRKYVVDRYNFHEIAERNTIDKEIIPLLESMVKCGFNVNFVGPVRSGKTTFLTTYQSYEDTKLEGVQIETDAEIPLHVIMPNAPIIQMVVDNDELDKALKPLMRSDADYLIMGEAREGKALRLMVIITKKGTRRVKGTFHTSKAKNFCYDVAQEIVTLYGGDIWAWMLQVAEGFQYIFEFGQMYHNRSEKKLKGIYEIRLNPETLLISTHTICKYDRDKDDWVYAYDIGEEVEQIGNEENSKAFAVFKRELKRLSELKPMIESNVTVSPYSRLMTGNLKGAATQDVL